MPQARNLAPEVRRHGPESGTETAASRAAGSMPLVRELRGEGKTLEDIADELNTRGYVTGGGKRGRMSRFCDA